MNIQRKNQKNPYKLFLQLSVDAKKCNQNLRRVFFITFTNLRRCWPFSPGAVVRGAGWAEGSFLSVPLEDVFKKKG